MLNLDTHVLIYALSGSVTAAERRLLTADSWSVSAIVLWELAKLRQLGRIEMDIETADFAIALGRIHIWPLDIAVCRQTLHLDFASDPADELIAATSIVHRVPLLTRDRLIRRSKLIPFAGANA